MWMDEYKNDAYNIRDGVRAVVTGGGMGGTLLQLENGQEAFTYFFGRLTIGTEVLCTVLKKSTEKGRVFVAIKSVIDKELDS